MKLKGKNAIVTGGATGIGLAIALRLAREGANIAVADINFQGAEKVVDEVKALGCRAIAVKTDVCKMEDVKRMVGTALQEFQTIDILINNAGVTAGEMQSSFCDSAEEAWDLVLNVNIKGTLNCTRAVINHMIQRKNGKVVNLSSTTGLVGSPGVVDYSVSKAGIVGFTMALAKEVVPYGIHVNAVAPGNTDTSMFRSLFAKQDKFDTKRIIESSGFGRLAKPDEIAAMVVFLVTDEASFITGQVFPVCGLRNIGTL